MLLGLLGKEKNMSVSFSLLFSSLVGGSKGGKRFVHAPCSHLNLEICRKFYNAGYITSFSITDAKLLPYIKIKLRTTPSGASALDGLRVVSKSSQRNYQSYASLERLVRTKGYNFLVRTSKGFLWSQEIRSFRVGGELICFL